MCDEGWSGLDCSQPRDRGFWTSVTSATPAAPAADLRRLARSQSSGAVWKGVLWVVGGHGSQLQLPFAMAFNISRECFPDWTYRRGKIAADSDRGPPMGGGGGGTPDGGGGGPPIEISIQAK